MFSVDSYIRSVEENLEKQSDLLIANLKNIFTYNFSPNIDLLDFSAFIEPINFEVSIRMFSMDRDANEVFDEGNDEAVFAGSVEVIQDIKYYQLNRDLLDDFIDNFYEKNYPNIYELEQNTFKDWFSRCWKKADGHSLHLPAYFGFHDEYKSFDLKNNRWIDDEEKWT